MPGYTFDRAESRTGQRRRSKLRKCEITKMTLYGKFFSRTGIFAAIGIAALLSAALPASAAPIMPGNIVVYRVGDGAAALTSAATASFLDEYTVAGTLVQTINLPTAVSGLNRALTNSGTATSEGGMSISPDGKFLSFAGYDAAPGATGPGGAGTSIATTTSALTNRVVGILNLSTGAVDTTTALNDAYSANNIRGAVTDGTNVWTSGTGATTFGGVHYTTVGSVGTSTQLSTTPTNVRRVEIFNGQLYIASGSSPFIGISTVGTGLPTTAGQTTTLIAADPATTTPASTGSPYEFFFSDPNTLYVADDRVTAGTNGGLQKYTMSGGTWSLAYTISPTTAGLRGITGVVTGGVTTLFGTTTGNTLVSLTDTGAGSTFSTLATGAPNTAFRDILFAPLVAVPEPGTLALLGLALLPGAAVLRRRRK